MPPPSALSKMAPWLRYCLFSGNYRSIIKADLYNIEETNEGPCRSTRLAFSLQSNLGYEYDMIFVCNTSSYHYNHLCHIFINPNTDDSYGQTQTGFTEIYAQSLSADCDIDL